MRLVESPVYERVMEATVDPVHEEIGEGDEKWELQVVVQKERLVGRVVVEFSVTAHLGEEEGDSEDRHDGEGDQGLSDFHTDLVFEEFGV